MKIPNIIKDENVKNGIVLVIVWILGVIVLSSFLGNLFNFNIPMDIITKIIVVPIILFFMYHIFKTDFGIIAKIILELLMALIIYKTFFKTPLMDKIISWVLVIAIIIWIIKTIIKKKGKSK